MGKLIEFCVTSKRLILTILTLLLITGASAYVNIKKEENPDVTFPFFVVSMTHDGISPEDAERLLIKPMEVHLRNIEGVKEITGVGREGGAYVLTEFYPDVSQDKARTLVREAMDMGKSRLPEDTLEPVLREEGTSDNPVVTIILYSNLPERTMAAIVRRAREELESVANVLEAKTNGERRQMLEVLIDPAKLNAYDISPLQLYNVVNANNRLVAAGALDTQAGRFSVRVDGLVEEADDVLSLPIKSSADGVVTLQDLTTVRRTFKDASNLARYNGYPAYTIDVIKRGEANAVETANEAKAVIKAMQVNWPDGIQVDYLFDQSISVADFLDTLRNNVVSAIILVAIIVVAALGTRSAILVGISIPGSFLFGIMCLHYMGNSINNVVLFGLILSVGLLVDGAIVVTEYADRKMVEGFNKQDAYIMAAKRMALPILSSTLTTVAAFLPMIFWPGIMGDFMSYIPVTVIYTLMGSFLMAMIFLPTLGAVIGRPGQADTGTMQHLAQDAAFDIKHFKGSTRFYAELLSSITKVPGRVLMGTAIIMGLIFVAHSKADLGSRVFSDSDPELIRVIVHARGNKSIGELDALVRKVENRVKGTEGVRSMWSTTSVTNGSHRSSEDVVGYVNLLMEDWYNRRPFDVVKADLRERIQDVPGVFTELAESTFGPIQGKDIQIRISSENPQSLMPVVGAIADKLASLDGVIEAEDTRSVPGIDWAFDVDRMEAGRYGTDVTTVGSFIQLMTNGMLAGRYRPVDGIDEEDIRIRMPFTARGIQAFDELYILTPKGAVPLTNLVERSPTKKIGKITRTNSERSVNVYANVMDGYQTTRIVKGLRTWIGDQNFNPAVNIHFAGGDEVQNEATEFLVGAMLFSLALMGLILLAQFNSYYQTMLILGSVILGAIGVLFGLLVTGREFSVVMTGIGIVALAGIVVNNNIVLIDTFNRFVREGVSPIEAIIHTGAQRLRPVMLTTGTTIIGLLPMALQFNIDIFTASVEFGSPTSKMWVDLAVAVVWGLGVSTILTLLITPAALALRENWKAKRLERRQLKYPAPAGE